MTFYIHLTMVRFNITGLRNNYNLNDLTKPNLKLFGIKVGESIDTNLEFTHQIDTIPNLDNSKTIGIDFDEEFEQKTYDIIDTILLGV